MNMNNRKYLLRNVRLYGASTDIVTEGDRILSIGTAGTPEGATVIDAHGVKVYPGLIDVHSHGCLGYDTMEGHLDEMADYQLMHGITTWYPTTMTMSRADILAACQQPLALGHGANLPGLHMEGPFINPKYCGAQNDTYITAPDLELLAACPQVKMVTVAPELPGAKRFIEEADAVISLGHTDADYDTALGALRAGARCLTHTFNAMPGIHHRAPGPILAGAEADAYAQLICDGRHVHPAAVRLLVRLYGRDRVVLISDSMRATGLGDGVYSFGGQPITVTDGYARTEGGALAGSTTNLFDCVRCAISFGIPEEDAFAMASTNPARLMGLNKGTVAPGYDADLVLVDDDCHLIGVMVRGEYTPITA